MLPVLCVLMLVGLVGCAGFHVIENKFTEKGQFGSDMDRCEYLSLRLGTELADIFNAPFFDKDWNARLYQDFIVENLGFTPSIAGGNPGLGGKTLTGKDAKQLHSGAKWVGSSVENSPYNVLNHKWVYMFGDSTTRQVWASYAAPFKGNDFVRNAKEYVRHYCNKQPHRKHHPKGEYFPEEGWGGPCGVNENTCHISGYGDGGILSYDWKHFPFEDYDEYFWSNQGPWIAGFPGEGVRRPDLLTVQFGMHSCWHASPHGAKSANYHLTHFNQSMFDLHVKNIWKLMAAMRSALDHDPPIAGASRNHTTIIFLTSGSIGMEEVGDETDKCILKMNRVTAEAARAYGFAVLDRGEIERRLVFKSFLSNHKHIPIETHLAQPAQNIVATSLLHLYDCLEDAKASRSREPGDTVVQYPVVVNKGSNAMSQPLYSPP